MPLPAILQNALQNAVLLLSCPNAKQVDSALLFVIEILGDQYETGLKSLENFSIEWYENGIAFLENPLSQKSFVLLQVSTCMIVAMRAFFSNGILQKAWSGILISVAYTVWGARDLKALCEQVGALKTVVASMQGFSGNVNEFLVKTLGVIERNEDAAKQLEATIQRHEAATQRHEAAAQGNEDAAKQLREAAERHDAAAQRSEAAAKLIEEVTASLSLASPTGGSSGGFGATVRRT